MSKARDLANFVSAGNPLADGTIDVADINGLTATVDELNYVDGVTSAIQTQLDGKQALDSNLTSFLSAVDLPTSDGTAGQVLTTDGSGNVTFADASGGGTHEFVATGAISTGDVVALRSDGTVEVIANTAIDPPTAGSQTTFDSGSVQYNSAVFDSNSNKVVVAYQDFTSSSGAAIVGTVSGTSITFGSEAVFNNASTDYVSAIFDSNSNKVVIAYRDGGNSNYGTAIVGTVSGTSISFGSEAVFNSGNTEFTSFTFDSNSNKVVIAYRDAANSDYGTAIVGTVSGTSITFGSEAVFNSAQSSNISTTFDSNSNKVVIAYTDSGNSSYGTAVVGTVSGTSISFGTPVVFESATTTAISATFDSNSNKVVIAYRDIGNSSYGTAVVGTVSGTSISFGTPVVFESADVFSVSATFDSTINKVVIAYEDRGNSDYGTAIVGTVSGTSISFGTPAVFFSGAAEFISVTFDSTSNQAVVAYKQSDTNSGLASVISTSSSNNTDWIGISTTNIADTGSGLVTILGGVNENQTGLTPNTVYYVSFDGSLATTGSVKIGKALSSTELLITEANT